MVNRSVDLNSTFIKILNIAYFTQEKNSNFNKRKNPTANGDNFLNKTSEIGFAKKF